MRFFTKKELFGVILILAVVAGFTLKGLKDATRRARDFQRKQDLGIISDALHKYHAVFGFFPPSEDGKIKGCKGEKFESVIEELGKLEEFDRDLFFEGLSVCEWGIDGLVDVQNENIEAFIYPLPSDPSRNRGMKYLYLSNTVRFQLYTYLEGEVDENGYDQKIVSRGLKCGVS